MPPHKAMTQTDGPGGTTIIRDLEIAKLGDFPLLADMAYLREKPATPRPVMYIIHGGGWAGGSKNLNLDWAQKGYFVFSVDYRLSDGRTRAGAIDRVRTGRACRVHRLRRTH